MKLEFELTKNEAEEILGSAIKSVLAGAASTDLQVSSVDWDRYGSRITVVLETPPKDEAIAEAA